MASLEKEYAYYVKNRAILLEKHRGQYIVIKDDGVLGTYDSHDAALVETLKSHPAGTFLIQKVDDEEQIMRFHSRVTFGGHDPVPTR